MISSTHNPYLWDIINNVYFICMHTDMMVFQYTVIHTNDYYNYAIFLQKCFFVIHIFFLHFFCCSWASFILCNFQCT